ncbi:MAG TPA: MFS transporter [Ardenticatenaceae bacterium]|jgi:EmrB/QacA subfamily drug resistance transporter
MRGERGGWIALAAVSLAVFVAALDLTVTAAVLPQLIVDFRVPLPGGLADAAWIVNGYLIAYVVTMPLMGRVSDLVGRRPVFLVSLALFVLGSVWAASVNSLWPMVAARVVQALGGGAMVPVALAAVSDALPERQRPLALGLIAAVDTAGWVAGPSYGAWLTTWLGWRWVFWLNVPVGILAAVLVWVALPRGARREHRMDWAGGALFTLFLLAFTMALYVGAPAGAEGGALLSSTNAPQLSRWLWPLLGTAIVALLLFIFRERRAAEPLFDLRLLSGRTFAAANAVSLLTGAILMAVMVEVPVLMQAVSTSIEAATATSGRLLAVFAGGMVLGALVAGPVLRRVSARWVTLAGLLVMIAGLWQMAQWEQGMTPTALMGPLGLAGLGLGLVTTPLASAVLERVAEAERGIASSLLLVARLLGMTLGLSVLVTWALRRFTALVSQVDISFTDPDAAALMAQAAVSAMTTVVTDLFFVTAIVGVVALLPALLLREEPRAELAPEHDKQAQ